jgi:hypothetical protein
MTARQVRDRYRLAVAPVEQLLPSTAKVNGLGNLGQLISKPTVNVILANRGDRDRPINRALNNQRPKKPHPPS